LKIYNDAGVLYDALAFLSLYACDFNDEYDMNTHYYELKKRITRSLQMPEYIYPFICDNKDGESFLYSVMFAKEPYGKCDVQGLLRKLNNRQYIFRAYIEYYFPNPGDRDIRNFMDVGPELISAVWNKLGSPNLEAHFLNSIIYFDEIVDKLQDIIIPICDEIAMYQEVKLLEFQTARYFNNDDIIDKLYAITHLNRDTEFTVSLSILKSNLILYKLYSPEHIILGSNFTSRLDEQYKYSNVNLLSFAQALGADSRLDIFNALRQSKSMCVDDFLNSLSYGKDEIRYSLRKMLENGIIEIDRIEGKVKYYRIDDVFIRVIQEQLTASS